MANLFSQLRKFRSEEKDYSPGRLKFALAALAIIAVCAAVLAWSQSRTKPAEVVIGEDVRVAVEVAATPATRERGLSGRDELAEGRGMLFLFPQPNKYVFWMKDMRFPIDILWIRGDELVDMTVDVPPPTGPDEILPSYAPLYPADKVLEVPAGFAQRFGLRLGESIRVEVDR